MSLTFDRDGAVRHAGAAVPFLCALDAIAGAVPQGQAGVRLHGAAGLAELLHTEALGGLAGERMRPVRAILFDKGATNNWALAWHQDRTIAVAARAAVPGFDRWSVKAGLFHVEPPSALLSRMVTMRVHLDSVDQDNAPLLIAAGSHRLGRVPEEEIDATVAQCGTTTCLAERGDVWLYATLIVHASRAAARPRRRRVLQVDFSRDVLPPPLAWLGI